VNFVRAGFIVGVAAVLEASGADWGVARVPADGTGTTVLEVGKWPTGGRFVLPDVPAHVIHAHGLRNGQSVALDWTPLTNGYRFEPRDRRTKLKLETVVLEQAEASGQFAGGRISFVPKEAKLSGTAMRTEFDSYGTTITGWTVKGDAATWDFKPTRWGMYELEVCYTAEGKEPVELDVTLAGHVLPVTLRAAPKADLVKTALIGQVYLAKSDPFSVRLALDRGIEKSVLRVKGITLHPAPEGEVPKPAPNGEIVLLSHAATTHSVMMRYEPATNKNCMGYWVNPADWAEWNFPVAKTGDYDVELWQGCGKGSGGSEVQVEVAGQKFSFVVQDTGHFQAFVPRQLGRIHLTEGLPYSLTIRPQRKQGAAVMDVRQVKLLPVAASK
jgi:hypothetical protein